MRSRAAVLVLAILLLAGFAALNWGEIIRPSSVWFGPFVMEAPLGAILLGLLAVTIVVFAVLAGAMRTQSLVESRQHFKSLEQQRTLADKAEASRFTDLRQHLDTQLRELRERDTIAANEFQKSMVHGQRELRTQLEQIDRTIAARLTEMEHRLDSRTTQPNGNWGSANRAAVPAVNESVHPGALPPEHGQSLRDDQAREEQLRLERVRTAQQAHGAGVPQSLHDTDTKVATADKPAESGWRRWF